MRESLRTDAFDYQLPRELIASHPTSERGASRMMVIDRARGMIDHRQFSDFRALLKPDDLCVFNNTRVIKARFLLEGGKRELLRLDFAHPTRWTCLVRPGKRFRLGDHAVFGSAVGTVVEILESGERVLEFSEPVDVEHYGSLALPHYLERQPDREDDERYQTVYACESGAIAAPTAGLHFTEALLARIPHAFVTLHVGVGTFQPVRAEYVEDHRMHRERFTLSPETAEAIARAKRVISVGTTVTRVLEHCGRRFPLVPQSGETDMFIFPPHSFRVVGGLLTNFHLPKSTLLMLVAAFAGRDLILEAYRQAVDARYRFYSYGDCMLIV